MSLLNYLHSVKWWDRWILMWEGIMFEYEYDCVDGSRTWPDGTPRLPTCSEGCSKGCIFVPCRRGYAL